MMPAVSAAWSSYVAAPHRVMFLPGALQAVAVMALWLIGLLTDFSAGTVAGADLPPPAVLHLWWMLYGVFPFFILGFLFTAAPNWLNSPPLRRGVYLGSGLAMASGALVADLGGMLPLAFAAGLALHLAGWLLGGGGLFQLFRQARQSDRRHLALILAALLLGALGEAALLAWWALAGPPWLLRAAESLAVWGFLVPVYLVVCHRMVPWFTGRVIANYVMVRPYGPLLAMLVASLAHAGLAVGGVSALSWLADLPLAALAGWFAARWGVARGLRQARLLAMLHVAFLWAVVAFALYALDALARHAGWGWSAGQAPLHVLGIGFFATMLIAMSSRVSLGHSGRALEADRATWGLFWLLQIAAVTRALPELSAVFPRGLVALSGALWLLVFVGWGVKYAPMYWRPRIDGKPG